MKLRVNYNQKALIGAIGPSAWAKLGPERWFDNYKMIIANARNFQKKYVINLNLPLNMEEPYTTQKIIDTPDFREVMERLPQEYKFIVYKPLMIPEGLKRERFICNEFEFSRFEDKRVFRDIFGEILPIPSYDIISLDSFLEHSAESVFDKYSRKFDGKFVIQDNKWGGGLGTFIVHSSEDVRLAQTTLSEERKGDHVIISRFVDGAELSIQVFISQDYVVRGPLQQQLVRNSDLQNPKVRAAMYFCGGKLIDASEVSSNVIEQVERAVSAACDTLRAHDYNGIFGMDFLVGRNEQAYVLEINARTTGILPLINEQFSEVPIYLLHILELANIEYEIDGDVEDAYGALNGPQSFLILFNKASTNSYLKPTIKTGNYRLTDTGLVLLNTEARWDNKSDCMIQLFATKEFPARPNYKLCHIFLRDQGFDSVGRLTDHAKLIVKHIEEGRIAC